MSNPENNTPTDDASMEGPDIEMPVGGDSAGDGADGGATASDGETKPGGLGRDGTIPADPAGVAAGHTGEASNFEPEEDEGAQS